MLIVDLRRAHDDDGSARIPRVLANGAGMPPGVLVVMPNGRVLKDDRAEGNVFESAPALAVFENDLLNDVTPSIELRYSIYADREHCRLAGLSMGGRQSLNFDLTHLEKFGWLGVLSSAPYTAIA